MSLEGFALCMQVLQRLRQTYSAADYATHFLEAAIKKAGIPIENLRKHASRRRARYQQNQAQLAAAAAAAATTNTAVATVSPITTTATPSSPGGIGNAISIPATAPPSNAALTPPPDMGELESVSVQNVLDESDLQLKLESFLQAPPSPAHHDSSMSMHPQKLFGDQSCMPDFSMPDASDDGQNGNLDAFLGSDPFLGHEGMPGMFSMNSHHHQHQHSSKSFELGNVWSEGGIEDMSKILDGVDLTFDDVIQVLETEIN